jgi:hypothetical protein
MTEAYPNVPKLQDNRSGLLLALYILGVPNIPERGKISLKSKGSATWDGIAAYYRPPAVTQYGTPSIADHALPALTGDSRQLRHGRLSLQPNE